MLINAHVVRPDCLQKIDIAYRVRPAGGSTASRVPGGGVVFRHSIQAFGTLNASLHRLDSAR